VDVTFVAMFIVIVDTVNSCYGRHPRDHHLLCVLPYKPVNKSTFQELKISPKNRHRLIHESELDIQVPVISN